MRGRGFHPVALGQPGRCVHTWPQTPDATLAMHGCVPRGFSPCRMRPGPVHACLFLPYLPAISRSSLFQPCRSAQAKSPPKNQTTPPPASLRICADGGANRLYDEVARRQAGAPDGPAHLPTAIVGDLDSIRPEVAAFYRAAGVEIVDLSADQDSTDLQKCVEFAAARRGTAGGHIVALGAHGGRLDHILSNLGALYRYRDLELVLVGDGNATRLVRAGTTVLHVARGREGPACGLVPLAGPARATTKGLRWDMGGQPREEAGDACSGWRNAGWARRPRRPAIEGSWSSTRPCPGHPAKQSPPVCRWHGDANGRLAEHQQHRAGRARGSADRRRRHLDRPVLLTSRAAAGNPNPKPPPRHDGSPRSAPPQRSAWSLHAGFTGASSLPPAAVP